ncbi:MAG: cell envelope integrity protein TolA [Burkholderiales bacterium]|jgi:colicin import membrane protein|nr:cell envelope integrity protein TolA [Burkholderiales bacterium]
MMIDRRIRRHPIDFFVALVFALIALAAFVALLMVSVSWRNPAPTPVTVEVISDTPAESPPRPEATKPQEPPPPPPPPPKPAVSKPPEPDADIAIKQKEEKKKAEEAERLKKEKAEKEKKLKEEREKKEKAERERKEKEKKEAQEKKEREEKARREQEAKAAAEREAKEAVAREAQMQALLAQQKALSEWTEKIRGKIRGNINLPPQITGNPEAIFDVTLLPTGEVLNATLARSSGNAAYDDAVARAITKSSPLPKPDRPDVFRRELRLLFRPNE